MADRQGYPSVGPNEVTRADVDRQIAAGHWHLLHRDGQVVGALRLLWSDDTVWAPDDMSAAYVHGLMVRRDSAGQGVGALLLQ
jgi:GNAT superfamily N-acetyltransferase